MKEVSRVLKPGGHPPHRRPRPRAAVPHYVTHLDACDADSAQQQAHNGHASTVLEQSVRREAHGTSQQSPLRRRIENWLHGDAHRRGEKHQWIYDPINLRAPLLAVGSSDLHQLTYDTSLIPDGNGYELDLDTAGRRYRPGSLHMDAVK